MDVDIICWSCYCWTQKYSHHLLSWIEVCLVYSNNLLPVALHLISSNVLFLYHIYNIEYCTRWLCILIEHEINFSIVEYLLRITSIYCRLIWIIIIALESLFVQNLNFYHNNCLRQSAWINILYFLKIAIKVGMLFRFWHIETNKFESLPLIFGYSGLGHIPFKGIVLPPNK